MSDALTQHTDWESHPITGYVRLDGGGHGLLDGTALISEILPNLWMGGCKDGVQLPDSFGFVLSLYPWEQYILGRGTERTEVKLYDSEDVPPTDQLLDLQKLVNDRRQESPVLVHCQAGLNRSGLITGLALIHSGMTPVDAIALMREKRSEFVLCNKAFEGYLLGLAR